MLPRQKFVMAKSDFFFVPVDLASAICYSIEKDLLSRNKAAKENRRKET